MTTIASQLNFNGRKLYGFSLTVNYRKEQPVPDHAQLCVLPHRDWNPVYMFNI